MLAAFVVSGVVLAILLQATDDQLLQSGKVAGLRVPVDIHRLDLGPQEVIRAAGAEFSQSRGVDTVDEPLHGGIGLQGADHALLAREFSAKPRQKLLEDRFSLGLIQRLVLLSAKRFFAAIASLDIAGGFVDQIEAHLVDFVLVIGSVEQTVLAENDTLEIRLGFPQPLQG